MKPTDNTTANVVDSGVRTGSRASSPGCGSAIHMLIMIRRYKNAAITDASIAMIAIA